MDAEVAVRLAALLRERYTGPAWPPPPPLPASGPIIKRRRRILLGEDIPGSEHG